MSELCLIDIPLKRPLSYHMCGKFEAPSPQWSHEDFILEDFELILMTSGSLYLEYHNKQYTIKEGEFLLLPPYSEPNNHRKGFQPSDCSFYWLHFLPANPHTILEANLAHPFVAIPEDNVRIPVSGTIPNQGKLIALMKQLQNDVRLQYNPLALNYETSTILCELFNQLEQESKKEDIGGQKQIYSDIVDYVRSNSTQNLKVSDIALHFGYNDKYLSHLFSRLSGIPLKQFIIKTKMDTANFMLTDTNLNITEIASSLGYSDAHNFTRAYKKFTGISPSEYRQAYAKRLLFHV